MTRTTAEVAAQLFAHIEAGHVEAVAALYHDDIAVWHNFDNATQAKAANLRTLAGLIAIAPQRRYEVLERHTIGDRFIQRHNLHCRTAAGAEVVIPACIFITVQDGAIRRIDEYLDIAQTQPLQGGPRP
jgi:ketosteroid isomerase-like protein